MMNIIRLNKKNNNKRRNQLQIKNLLRGNNDRDHGKNNPLRF